MKNFLHYYINLIEFSQDCIAQLWIEPTDWIAFQATWNAKIAEPGVFRYLAYKDNKPHRSCARQYARN